jgi:hypothetical protein
MFRKLTSGVLFLTILLVLPLILIPAPNGYAGGPEPPGYEGIPAGGKTITGYLAVGLTDPRYDSDKDTWVGDTATLFIGACGKTNVVIGPFIEIGETTLSSFIDLTTEEYLEGLTFEEAGPPGCFSPEGGEALIITKIKKFTRAINYYWDGTPEDGSWVIEGDYSGMGAELTIEQYIEIVTE